MHGLRQLLDVARSVGGEVIVCHMAHEVVAVRRILDSTLDGVELRFGDGVGGVTRLGGGDEGGVNSSPGLGVTHVCHPHAVIVPAIRTGVVRERHTDCTHDIQGL